MSVESEHIAFEERPSVTFFSIIIKSEIIL